MQFIFVVEVCPFGSSYVTLLKTFFSQDLKIVHNHSQGIKTNSMGPSRWLLCETEMKDKPGDTCCNKCTYYREKAVQFLNTNFNLI